MSNSTKIMWHNEMCCIICGIKLQLHSSSPDTLAFLRFETNCALPCANESKVGRENEPSGVKKKIQNVALEMP